MGSSFSDPFGKGDEPPAPNYQPLNDAAVQSAKIMADLGQKQLDESKRQYDQNSALSKQVVDAQLGLMSQSKAQGDDYYKYMVENQRPLEKQLQEEALKAGSQEEQQAAADRAAGDILRNEGAQNAMSLRQGASMGWSPARLAAMNANSRKNNNLSLAYAMNAAREKEKNVGYAKRMDVAGMYRGLSGASQGAYGLANQSGNSAVGNQMAPGQAYMQGLGAGAQTTASGRQLLQQGLGGVMNAQTSTYNAGMGGPSAMENLGGLVGMGTQLYGAFGGGGK